MIHYFGLYVILKNNFLFFLFTFSGFSLFAMEVVQAQKGIHVVYSPAWYEDATRKKHIAQGQEKLDGQAEDNLFDPIMTFQQQKTGASLRSGRTFPLGDDDTTFYNSHAMKFASLGDSLSMPAYTDASTKWYSTLSSTALYTKPNVLTLAQHLYDRVITEERKKILLVGPCVGASIAIECLKKLVTFEQNPEYFEKTSINSIEQAQAIIAAINNGGIVAMVPLMSVKKHNAVALPAALLSGLTLTVVTAALYSCAGPAIVGSSMVQAGLVGAGSLTYSVLEDSVKNAYASVIKYMVVPLLSRFNYNPFHENPIDNIECLHDKITGPVALNFTMQDWVMQWKDIDLLRLRNALSWKEGFNAHVVITDDKGHMEISPVFLEYLKGRFIEGKTLRSDGDRTIFRINTDLKKKIHPWGIFSRFFALKKLAFGIVFICLAPVLLKFLQK